MSSSVLNIIITLFTLVLRLVLVICYQCHRVVANRLHSRFQAWLSSWVKGNVTNDQESGCRDWLLGRVDGLHPCTTTCESVTDTAITHNKYSVTWDKDKNKNVHEQKIDDKSNEDQQNTAS